MTIKEVCEKYGMTQDTLRYYERIGMIPPVTRTAGGIRDYQQEDLKWVELAKCMRSAGLSVESIIAYARLFQQGDETISARLRLLREQQRELQNRRDEIDAAISRLQYKISRYEDAIKTGKLVWKTIGEGV